MRKLFIYSLITGILSALISSYSFAFGFTTSPSIRVGSGHAVLLKHDGTVWTWGLNTSGRLGDPAALKRGIAKQVPGLQNIVKIEVSAASTLALDKDGNLYSWGYNNVGQLGIAGGGFKDSPTLILTGVMDMKIKAYGLALKSDGTVWSWGDNSTGELGDGTKTSNPIPRKITGLSNIKSISAGDVNAFALSSDGSLWAWGRNTYGQLGDGSVTEKLTPTKLNTIANVKQIFAGNLHTTAITDDNNVWTWGSDLYLGDGTTTSRSTPAMIGNFGTITKIVDTESTTILLKQNGTLLTWGVNDSGQMTDGRDFSLIQRTPVSIATSKPIVDIDGYHTVVAITSDGYLLGWGEADKPILGDMTGTLPPATSPLTLSFTIYTDRYTQVGIGITSGTLSITAPSNINLGLIILDGKPQSVSQDVGSIIASDFRGIGDGYKIYMSASRMKETTTNNLLPAGSITMKSPTTISIIDGSAINSPSINSFNTSIDQGSSILVATAVSGKGNGAYQLNFPTNALTLNIQPDSAKVGTYESVITISVVAGP